MSFHVFLSTSSTKLNLELEGNLPYITAALILENPTPSNLTGWMRPVWNHRPKKNLAENKFALQYPLWWYPLSSCCSISFPSLTRGGVICFSQTNPQPCNKSLSSLLESHFANRSIWTWKEITHQSWSPQDSQPQKLRWPSYCKKKVQYITFL